MERHTIPSPCTCRSEDLAGSLGGGTGGTNKGNVSPEQLFFTVPVRADKRIVDEENVILKIGDADTVLRARHGTGEEPQPLFSLPLLRHVF